MPGSTTASRLPSSRTTQAILPALRSTRPVSPSRWVFILNDLFVHETARRKGVASELLAAVEAYAWSLNAGRVTLNVARDNTAGQALYEAEGWRQDGQYFMYHRFPNGQGRVPGGQGSDQ